MAFTLMIHGNAVSAAERPGGSSIVSPGDLENVDGIAWTDVVGLRQGWGTTFRGKGGKLVWFHIPIPTPMVVNDVPCQLKRLDVLFETNGPATVESVHLWGNTGNRWFARDNLRAARDVSIDFLSEPRPLPGPIGVSVGVHFAQSANITFRGAKIELI